MSLAIDEVLSLPYILAWVRSNWLKILLGGIVCALLAVPIALFKSKTYEATTTLLVSPPTFKVERKPTTGPNAEDQPESIAEMMPRAMPVEAYKAIALSVPLLDEVIRTIPLEDIGVQTLLSQLDVELIQMGSRSTQGITYTQALMFHAKASDPELAATIAQAWTDIFKEKVDTVASEGIHETFALLKSLEGTTKSELEEADLKLAEHRKTWNLDLIKAQLEAKQKEYTEFEGTLKQTEVKLASGEMKLKALEAELLNEPQKNAFFRAPSDDAYWIAGTQNGGKPKIKPDQGLLTEEQNPTYIQIRSSVVTAKEENEGLKATRDSVLLKLDELKSELDTLTTTFSDQTVERDKLTRESESLKSSYSVVRAQYEKGRMADQTQASDIVIAGKAAAPDDPVSPGSPVIVLAAFALGLFAVGSLLILRDISKLVPAIDATGEKA